MPKKKAIIIGAGVAGIATAIRLAVQGFEVSVYEKNSYLGGKLTHFEKGGFHFDAGPSLFTQPENIEALFTLTGENIKEFFSYQSQAYSCKYFYEDGTVIEASTSKALFVKELQNKLGEDADTVSKYLSQAAELYNKVGKIFLNYSLHKFNTLKSISLSKALSAVKGKHLFSTLHKVNASSFKHPHTVQLFNRYATYNGSNPYKAPGMLSLIAHLEHNQGTYYPKGGMISITNALVALAEKKGVVFHTNSTVSSIESSSNAVNAIKVNNRVETADIVVSNMDVYFTYSKLLGMQLTANKVLKQERSSSALIFYWGISYTFPQLQLHNILFSNNYEEEFKCIFDKKALYQDPTIYINITSKCEPNLQAPMGKENWFVMVNAPANNGQNWEEIIKEARENIIRKIGRVLKVNIATLIEVEQVLSPVTIESNTNSYMGSLYGTSSNSKMAAFLRHPNFSKMYKNLFFVGGSVHPGGGIPLCLKSAEITANLIKEQFAN